MVVDRESATLGYPNEQTALLNATHRGICKFDSPSDSNFISLRNTLVSMMKDVVQKGQSPQDLFEGSYFLNQD